ncbi:MAG: phytoene/squalene synthase family protein [Verrucomicrobiota bacterium]
MTQPPLTHPGALLKAVSRSFYLSLRFLPEPTRGPLALGYLLARTSDTLADSESRPLNERLDALSAFDSAIQNETAFCLLREFPQFCVNHPGEQKLLEHSSELQDTFLSQPPEVRAELRQVMQTIIGGQRDDLHRFGQASAENPAALQTPIELQQYTYAVAGCVGEFWTRICALSLPEFATGPQTTLREEGRKFGQGLQLVNILRDLPNDLRAGRCYLPAQELVALGLTPASLLSSGEAARPVFLTWLNTASEWLEAGTRYEERLQDPALKFSVSLPRVLGQKTLETLSRTPSLEAKTRVKVTRSTVLLSALDTAFRAISSSPCCY